MSGNDAWILDLDGRHPTIDPEAFVAPAAVIAGDVSLGAHASVWYSSVLRGDSAPINVGAESNIQDGCVLHADPGAPLTIGDRVTVGHRVVLHGATIESDVLIGMGAVVMNRVRIGAGSLIGAGALLTEGTAIPPNSLVIGSPGEVRRPVDEAEQAMIAHGARVYMELAALHRRARRIDQEVRRR
jgi:carbonic anhydrase/acetyltransferase-like protein (isoleucine patch superfamily)